MSSVLAFTHTITRDFHTSATQYGFILAAMDHTLEGPQPPAAADARLWPWPRAHVKPGMATMALHCLAVRTSVVGWVARCGGAWVRWWADATVVGRGTRVYARGGTTRLRARWTIVALISLNTFFPCQRLCSGTLCDPRYLIPDDYSRLIGHTEQTEEPLVHFPLAPYFVDGWNGERFVPGKD